MAAFSRRKKIFFAVCALVLTMGGAETVLRLFDFSFYFNFGADMLGMPLLDLFKIRRIQNKTVDFDPDLFWKFKPNQTMDAKGVYRKPVHINSHGFRGADWADEKPAGTFRIACLGDSSTFGWSVGDGDAYPAQLGPMLKCMGKRVEVMNLGVTGYSSFQGRVLMLRSVKKWTPDVVVFAFGPNDRLPALKSDAEHQLDRTWDIGPVTRLLNDFQLYKLLKSGVVYIENREHGLSLNPQTYIPHLKRKVSPEEYADNARMVKAACDEIGALLVLVDVDYPSLPVDHVTLNLRDEAAKNNCPMPAGWKEWDGARVTEAVANELGVPILTMRDLFAADLARVEAGELEPERAEKMRELLGPAYEKEPWRMLMIDNGHPNEWGHEIVAEALAEIIRNTDKYRAECNGP